MLDGTNWCHLTPAGTLATYTVTMPPNPIDKLELRISSTQTLTALTIAPGAGQTVAGAATSLAANTSVTYRYLLASTSWACLGKTA